MFSWGIEYRIGTLAGGELRKTERHTHQQFCNIKLFIHSRIRTNITWLNCTHCQHQTIWIMFVEATSTKSGTWRSTNFHILAGYKNLSDWFVSLGVNYTRSDLLTSFPTYASTICYGEFFCSGLSEIFALKLSFVKLNYKENIYSCLLYKKNLQKWSKIYNLAIIKKNVIQSLEVNIAIIC